MVAFALVVLRIEGSLAWWSRLNKGCIIKRAMQTNSYERSGEYEFETCIYRVVGCVCICVCLCLQYRFFLFYTVKNLYVPVIKKR